MVAQLLSPNNLLLPLATAIGAFSPFPAQPKLIQELGKNEWYKWLMVFILIWQGGGAQRLDLSLVATAVTYLIVKLLDGAFVAGLQACPPPPPPPAEE